jgi:hypothetical protein
MASDESDPGHPSEPPPPFEDDESPAAGRRRMERAIRETIRRAVERGVEAGLGTLSRSEKAIRGVVGSEVPREVVGYIFSQVDETKNALVRGVAREVRDFLEATDLAREIERSLTRLSFEIKTEIRFIPNDAGPGVRPSVRAKVGPRRSKRSSRPPPEPPPEEVDDDVEDDEA